jgi:two-component system, LytTR family, sensor kinase
MKKKLISLALTVSPLIAIYGASPFYVFEKINLKDYFLLTVGLLINVLLVFAVHIYFEIKYPNQNKYVRFIITYLINFIPRVVLYMLDPVILILKDPTEGKKYFLYPLLVSVALNAIVMILVTTIVTQLKKSETEAQLQQLQIQNTEAQKMVLINQLQPHFLFNALSILKSLIGTNPIKAEEYVLKLSDFLRYTAKSSKKAIVTIAEELQFVEDYIALQKTRFDNSFNYTIQIDEDTLNKKIPILSLQTLVENIFKHNVFTEKQPLAFSIKANTNFLIVYNEKFALKPNTESKIGLQNLNERYVLITGSPIIIKETPNSFEVQIPIIT